MEPRQCCISGFPTIIDLSLTFLRKAECKDPNLFLAIWAQSHNAHNRSDELDLNTLYCKQSYHYETDEVTVDGTDGSIMKADPVGERTNFTWEDKIINIVRVGGNVAAAAKDLDVNRGISQLMLQTLV